MRNLLLMAATFCILGGPYAIAQQSIDVHTGETVSVRLFNIEKYKTEQLERKVAGLQKAVGRLFARVTALEKAETKKELN